MSFPLYPHCSFPPILERISQVANTSQDSLTLILIPNASGRLFHKYLGYPYLITIHLRATHPSGSSAFSRAAYQKWDTTSRFPLKSRTSLASHSVYAWPPAVTVPMVNWGWPSRNSPMRSTCSSRSRRCVAVSLSNGSTVMSSFRPERRRCQTPATVPSMSSTGKFPAWPPGVSACLSADRVGIKVGLQPYTVGCHWGHRGIPGRQPCKGSVDLILLKFSG